MMRDRDVREALVRQLATAYAGDDETRIVEEMGVWSGSVRIDIAVINGELTGYELKSDRDTLERLPFQADLYSRVFDKLVLVVGSRHAPRAREHIPEWWGITVATQGRSCVVLTPFRETRQNPSPDPYLLAQLLWKNEALAILGSFNLAAGWRSKRIREIHRRLAAELSFSELSGEVRRALKARSGWLRDTITGEFNVSIDSNLDPAF